MSSRISRRLSSQFTSSLESVPDAAHGDDALGMRGIGFDFLAQPANVDVDSACVAVEIVAPEAGEQEITREDRALVTHQFGKQAELLWAEHQLVGAQEGPAADQVEG